MVTVELNREVARNFMNIQYPMEYNMPFYNFAIQFPVSTGLNDEEYNKFAKRGKILNTQYVLVFNITDDKISCVCNIEEKTMLKFSITDKLETDSDLGENETKMLISLCINVMAGVMYQFAAQKVEKQVDEIRERRSNSNSAIPTSSKRYVYKTRYRFNTIATPRKQYQRKTECWQVIGHKRRYKDENGEVYKEVWVNGYTKGSGIPKDKEYKITRVD